jgi:hypothetical protein
LEREIAHVDVDHLCAIDRELFCLREIVSRERLLRGILKHAAPSIILDVEQPAKAQHQCRHTTDHHYETGHQVRFDIHAPCNAARVAS